ncbi:MAG: DNA repair protein RecN [Candidatus Aegiribacteria sp.]|nr:DNA repair protein RecN [Candidatus Aegiribacteria sp.]
MLISLTLRNLATISDTSIKFEHGLNILTGETGAGKSILVDGILLALGDRADTSLVRPGSVAASVEAMFILEDGSEFLVRREVRSKGRSRYFINDELTTLEDGRNLISGFIDLHSQGSTPALLRRHVQRAAIDEFSGCTDLACKLNIGFGEYRSLLRRSDELSNQLETIADKKDIAQHELSLIEKLDPSAEDYSSLMLERRELKAVQNGAEVLGRISEGISGDDGILGSIGEFRHSLANSGIEAKNTLEFLEQADIALTEASSECESIRSRIDSAPWRIQEIDDRLDAYAFILGRCGGMMEHLLNRRSQLNSELERYDLLEKEYEQLQEIIPSIADRLHGAAIAISESRIRGAEELEKSVQNELELLGMPGAVFQVVMSEPPPGRSLVIEDVSICSDGCEIPEFFFSANPGMKAGPLSSVASGGEMSRVSLVLKLALAGVTQAPTMVFDEIDSGVGGETANLLADSLRRVSERRQVIVITHLPQIASKAHRHLAVSKEIVDGLPATRVDALSDRGSRIEELARLLGGGKAATEHAEKMIITDIDQDESAGEQP